MLQGQRSSLRQCNSPRTYQTIKGGLGNKLGPSVVQQAGAREIAVIVHRWCSVVPAITASQNCLSCASPPWPHQLAAATEAKEKARLDAVRAGMKEDEVRATWVCSKCVVGMDTHKCVFDTVCSSIEEGTVRA